MTIQVKLFAGARELAGASSLEIQAQATITARQLRAAIAEAYPKLRSMVERSALAVNEEFAEEDDVIPGNAAVALLPPVSGG